MLPAARTATNKKSRLVHALAACTVAALLASCTASGPDLLRQGERLMQRGKFTEAVAKLEAARDLMPQTALVWNHLGLAYHGAGRPADAVQAYTQALRLNRDLYAARYNLGCLHLEQNNLPAAINELTTFTSMQPSAPDGWLKLATAQMRARQHDAAERSLTHAVKLRPKDPAALNVAGMVQLGRRRPREAAGYFEAALAAEPGYAPALLNLAVTHHQQLTNRPVALAKYRAYLTLKPRPANWDEVNQLAQQLERELAPPPKTAPAAALAPVAPTQPATKTAAPPAVPASRTNLAAPLVAPATNRTAAAPALPPAPRPPATQQVAKARLGVTSAPVSNPPPTTPPQKKLEVVELQPEQPIRPAREVAVVPRPAPVPTPQSPPPVAEKASAAPAADKDGPGILQRLNPVRWFSRSEPEAGAAKQGTPPAPGRSSPSTTPMPPPVPPPARESAEVTPLPATEVAAAPRYRYLRPTRPTNGNRAEAQRHFARGWKDQNDGRLTPAITEYLAAVQADGSFFEAQYNLGLAAFEAGGLSRSLSAYEHALSINPTHVDARFSFALALQKAGYPQDAANELQKLLAEQPREARAHLTLANLCAQQLNQPQKAREHYYKVLQLDPRNPQAPAIRYWISTHP